MNFWQWVLLLLWWFLFFAYLVILFQILSDLFRDSAVSGWLKAVWILFLVLFPYLTALVYVIARGKGMAGGEDDPGQDPCERLDRLLGEALGLVQATKHYLERRPAGSAPALGELSRRALARAGLTGPDFSERRINARSDHWPFFERGIPVLVFHSDDEEDYHQPTDDAPKITVEVMARIVRAVAMSVWETADAPERPRLRQLQRF